MLLLLLCYVNKTGLSLQCGCVMNLIKFEIGEGQGGLSVLKELKMGSNSLEL